MFNWKALGGLAVCILSGLSAMASEMKNQQQEKKIEDMENRLSKLEEGRE